MIIVAVLSLSCKLRLVGLWLALLFHKFHSPKTRIQLSISKTGMSPRKRAIAQATVAESPRPRKERRGAAPCSAKGKKRQDKKKKNKKKKGNKGKKGSSSEEVNKRKIVRGVKQKYCVLCMNHSRDLDPLQEWDEDTYGPPPHQPLAWGHPRSEHGVEGSECYYCRRLHRANQPLSAFHSLLLLSCHAVIDCFPKCASFGLFDFHFRNRARTSA